MPEESWVSAVAEPLTTDSEKHQAARLANVHEYFTLVLREIIEIRQKPS